MRIELSGDNWWEIKDKLTHGDRRWIDEEVQANAFVLMASMKDSSIDLDSLPKPEASIDTPMTAREEDATVFRGTVKWSFGDKGITEEAIGERDWDDFVVVLAKVKELYGLGEGEDTDAGKGNSAKPSRSRSGNSRSRRTTPVL